MPFDGLAIKAITRELNSELIDARIDKIYQPERDEIFLSIRQAKAGTVRLVISANPRWARIHISSEKKANPSQPSSFCMLLRKYLEGGKIKEIKQIGMERIVYIRIEALNDFKEWTDKLLICEFMGRHSNIILISPENGLILDANKKYSSDVREVYPGKEYITPPARDKMEPLNDKFQDFTAAMWNQTEDVNIASALFNIYTGLSPYCAREICAAAGLDCSLPVEQCGEYELSQLYNSTRTLITNIDQGIINPVVQYQKNVPLEFTPYQPLTHSPEVVTRDFASMNEACDAYYLQKLSQIRLESMQVNLSRNIKEHLNKAYKKKFLQEGDLSHAQENEKFRVWGELLTSYAHLYKKGDTVAVLNDFYTGEQISLNLDVRYTPIQNAQRFFKTYNKSRGAQKHLEHLMAENQHGIDYLESVLVAVEQADNPAQIEEIIEELEKEGYLKARSARGKNKPERSQPRKFISSDGLEIFVGRNNHQNDRLTLRESDRNDLWLHTKNIPGTHVIISLPPTIKLIDQVPDQTLEEAATLAAFYSKASSSPKVEVDYTFRFNVKKPGGARPGMVIYDNYWTIVVKPNSEILQKLLDYQAD
ncbi:MAG: NFACT RNA binding domain-containing protein [Syntrophomonas sp.]|nr:NFACT RNA binding domain-containing protein [Syntrophomonas sp.]